MTKDFTLHDDTGSIRLQIAPAEDENSYSAMPVDSTVNGAYIINYAGYSWVIKSPREENFYLKIKKKCGVTKWLSRKNPKPSHVVPQTVNCSAFGNILW